MIFLVGHDIAVENMDNAIGVFRHVWLVCDKYDRFALRHVEILKCMQYDFAGLGIKISCRLISKDERRIVHERPCDRDTLFACLPKSGSNGMTKMLWGMRRR